MGKTLTVNPLKTSPALGAAYALQGIKGAIALFHAAPGCTFLGKVLMTQHVKEPVGLVGTDIKEMPTIMGGLDELKNKILDVTEKFKPSVIGVIGTALSEVRGEDVETVMSSEFGVGSKNKQSKGFHSELRTHNSELIYIPCPDYMGGFDDGYAKAVEVMLENMAEAGPVISDQINILPSAFLTIGDLEEIKETVSAFGLKPVVLPDLSLSMDGSKARYGILPLDGLHIEEIKRMGRAAATIAIGKSMQKAGEILRQKFKTPLYSFGGLTGLEAMDEFIKLLMNLSGKDAPENIRRWRKRLIDGMVDTHLIMADKKIAIGLDGDMPSGISSFCREMGMSLIADCPSPFPLPSGERVRERGDLEDLEDMARDADLLIANSHGKEISDRLGIPLLRMGFPVYDRFGETLKVRVGYRGTLNFLFDMANIFQEGRNESYHRNHPKRQGMDAAIHSEHQC
ncbi:MAG: nitrogenase iron-molybdenum cofactor biosynthesis protein NifN [Deltaproteobacteria bacterium]|nr:nitrogenase iron-molybdenum cofactor biosynthesis protein NifN [Deltaproteobacteria bacterium]